MRDVFKWFLEKRGADRNTKSLLDISVPRSQKNLLRRQTRVIIKGKTVSLVTSEWGKSLSDDTLPKTPTWGKFKNWLQANQIEGKYHFPVFYAVTKRPRNPHKGWLDKLKQALIQFFKTGRGGE
jgi:hypothetical protein